MSVAISTNVYPPVLKFVGMDGSLNLMVDQFCSCLYREPGNLNNLVSELSIDIPRSFSKCRGLLEIHLALLICFVNILPALKPENIAIVIVMICSIVINPGIQPE